MLISADPRKRAAELQDLTKERVQMRMALLWLAVLSLVGCGEPSGPASTDTSSAALPSLAQRVEFLERYVTFRRGYTDLGFHIVYHNNGGGMMPGPSDWDVRLVAAVPPAELNAWVPPDRTATPVADTQWLAGIPGAGRAAGIREWYEAPGVAVGIDREHSVVVYRRWTQ